jgi:aspartyl-tRNA(Asn)/glutamyl-tRNA(Gln) amidotransferase subunit C
MTVALKDVSYVSDLANLDLTVEERECMMKDLNSILGFIDQLNELDTAHVAPMTQGLVGARGADDGPDGHARRPDDATARPSLSHDSAVQNAPASGGGFFKVPKVIER